MAMTLEDAKTYLRVDSSDEDSLIAALLESAKSICADVARNVDAIEEQPVYYVAVMYALAYLYEHREEADHTALIMTLRSILFGIRKEVF